MPDRVAFQAVQPLGAGDLLQVFRPARSRED